MMRIRFAAIVGLCLLAMSVVGGHGAELPWSFQPLRSINPPPTNSEWARNRIDLFIAAGQSGGNLKPAEAADRRILIRRAYFDLVGMPPTAAEVTDFQDDPSPNAFADQVDRLLASPQYGERWGRHWLDLARYVDATASWLESTASAWLYRDWVVAAYNQDLPYPEFVRKQLANDLINGCEPKDNAALGFLGLSPNYWKELQLPPEIIKGTVADEWEERVDALGRTFLGLTLACARCHDHKSDPITQQDYYALAGVFASIRMADRPTMSEEIWAPVAQARKRVAALEKQKKDLKKKKPKDLKEQTADLDVKIKKIQDGTPHYFVPTVNGVEEAALFVVAKTNAHGTSLDYKMGQARDLKVHKRGDPNLTGEKVRRRFLSVFNQGKPRLFKRGSGRLDLADAILEDAQPLAARVIVNRVWQQHFGRGLVSTPSEFGNIGDKPTHPDLLEDLTARFVANGWSFKWLHREILRSATWQQSSLNPDSVEKDPDNNLLARMPRRRLDIESWRDSMLKVTGALDGTLGGKSTRLDDARNSRRTLYGGVNRRNLDKMLAVHDFPDPTAHAPARNVTTTPMQQLFALNSPFMEQQATTLATLLRQQPEDHRIGFAYSRLFQRRPTEKELLIGRRYLGDVNAHPEKWSQYAQALLGSNEFLFVD